MNKVYYNEYDKNKAAALRQLIKDGIISSGDVDDRPIQEVKSNDVKGYTRWHFFAGFGGWDIALQIAGWPANRPISTVSCPCQDYSTSGPKTRQQGQRHLWPYYARIATESGFPEIIGEQVDEAIAAGWTDDAFFDLEEKTTPALRSYSQLTVSRGGLKEAGYTTVPTPLASDYRDRGDINMPSIKRRMVLGKQIHLSMLFKGTPCPFCVSAIQGYGPKFVMSLITALGTLLYQNKPPNL